MRYRIRATLATGQPAIIKPDAANPFEALSFAARALAENGHTLATIKDVRCAPMKPSKQSSVYIGKVPSGKGKGKGKQAEASASATPATAPATKTTAQPAAAASKPAPAPARK